MGTIYLCNIFDICWILYLKRISQQQTCNFNLFLTVASFHVLYLLYTNASCEYLHDYVTCKVVYGFYLFMSECEN